MSSKSPRATSSTPWLEPPPPYRSKLQDEAPEHPHGSHEGNGQLDLAQVDYTIPDKKLLAVSVELVVTRVDPEKSKALLGDRPNTRRPIRRRVHRGIAKRADILPSLGHGWPPYDLIGLGIAQSGEKAASRTGPWGAMPHTAGQFMHDRMVTATLSGRAQAPAGSQEAAVCANKREWPRGRHPEAIPSTRRRLVQCSPSRRPGSSKPTAKHGQ
jgi:hypothetical protein